MASKRILNELKDLQKDPPTSCSADMHHLYKNWLQTYTQKRNLQLPIYSTEFEGPPHARLYRAKVTFNDKTDKNQQFPTIKEAEHAAAKVALESLPHNETQEDDSGLYKNLLQKLGQKKGFCIPKYETVVSGPPHSPTFVLTVEIKQSFPGEASKSKKLAEMNVAKFAYVGLRERKEPMFLPICTNQRLKVALMIPPLCP